MEKYSSDKNCVIMSREQVRSVDSWAINTLGIPGVVLMENAGRSCAKLIKQKLSNVTNPKVCIFCGTGNNGGDGYVIARHLLNARFRVIVIVCGDQSRVKGDAKINLDILEGLNQSIEQLNFDETNITQQLSTLTVDADLLVDAIFGTGLAGQLREPHKNLIENINVLNKPILAVDIPSGMDCDTGQPLGAAIKADCTVTFVAVKKSFASPDATNFTGDIYVASIGIEPPAIILD